MIRRPPRSTHCISSAASDVYKRQVSTQSTWGWTLENIKMEEIPFIVSKYASTGCNTVHFPVISVGSGCGTNPDGFFFKSLTEPNNNPDLLGEFLKEFHKRNIKVIIYFNGHSFVREFYNRHPEWVMVSEKGEPVLDVYKTGVSACPNNAGYREWQAGVIRDLCGYEIDGVFLDGDIFFEKTCYCKTCKELFRQKYNMEMPLKSLRNNPSWRLLREFQIDSLTSYVEHLYSTLKKYRPQALLYCNAGLRTANWATGRQNRRLMEVQDMLLSEGGFLYSNINTSPIWRTECENKLCMTQSGGKPVISGMAMDHKQWNWFQLPDAEVRLMMHSAIAVSYTHLTLPTICSVQISVVAVSLKKKKISSSNYSRRYVQQRKATDMFIRGQ
eukprot:TRINITY_DN10174_c0_g1_i4.p1 TRINITY_DN10174_c0_g1~~TRINITY_DN10174_c0_g1_i4.p1  ORF type:complete len:385 (+),score=46.92 TRINITY_DN10174_c0_g1_i4:144-1298(+)